MLYDNCWYNCGIFFPLIAAKIDDSERLRPEELNQQNIEALVAESNLVLFNAIIFIHACIQTHMIFFIFFFSFLFLIFMLCLLYRASLDP